MAKENLKQGNRTKPAEVRMERRERQKQACAVPKEHRREARKTAVDHALDYAAVGIPIIWIPSRSKAPVIKGWPKVATTDQATIKRWAEENPRCNFGLVMGDGFIAIDIDDPSAIAALESRGLKLTNTRLHSTPRGGFHYLFTVPPGVKIKNSVASILPGVDIRSKAGQIVCPGSVHPNGGIYEIEDARPIAPLPDAWQGRLTVPARNKSRSADGKVAEGGRNSFLAREAGKLHARGLPLPDLKFKLCEINDARCAPPLPENEVATIAESIARYPRPENVAALLNGERPRVLLSTDNRLVSHLSADLARHLQGMLYTRNSEVVIVEHGRIRIVTPQEFRTLVEQKVTCCKMRSTGRGMGAVEVGVTMNVDEARAVLAASQFHAGLLPLKGVSTFRMPVMRANDKIELPLSGYDSETQMITCCEVEYSNDMTFDEAVEVLRDLYSEFEFADSGRSLSVAVAALLGQYAKHLVPPGTLRPAFIVTKNGEGAGATTVVASVVVPILGYLPTGAKPEDDAEMGKMLTSAAREARDVVLLDNVKKTIGGAPLEAFISAVTWSDRLLGLNVTVTVENNLTVFATGNGCTITPDMRRRSLIIELHLSVERAEDRQFTRPLNVATLRAMRPRILAACFAMVRHWDDKGRPQPSRSHSAFPEWASVFGGIVEAAGFECPFATPSTLLVADEDGDSMRILVAAMHPGRKYSAAELYLLCRRLGIFLHLVGLHEGDMGRSELSTMGRLLARYDKRSVGSARFVLAGTGHGKRFFVDGLAEVHGPMVEHAVYPDATEHNIVGLGGKYHANHVDRAPTHCPHRAPLQKFTQKYRDKDHQQSTKGKGLVK